MLCSILKRPNYFNKQLSDYCLKSTNESIKKMIEKCDEERKYKSIKLNLTTNDSYADISVYDNANEILYCVMLVPLIRTVDESTPI